MNCLYCGVEYFRQGVVQASHDGKYLAVGVASREGGW
jgi:hypothetical protein